MTDVNELLAGYIAVWNENDAASRAELIAEVFTEDVDYTDPLVDVHGREALSAVVDAVHGQFPGFRFRLGAAGGDAHHDVVRFTWELAQGDDEALVIGFDVAEIAADGRIGAVHGFLDKVPAL